MLHLPSVELVLRFGSIAICIAPAAAIHLEFDQTLSREYYIEQGWSEVYINTAQARLVSVCGGVQEKRLQYALRHIGAITIKKSLSLFFKNKVIPLLTPHDYHQDFFKFLKKKDVVYIVC